MTAVIAKPFVLLAGLILIATAANAQEVKRVSLNGVELAYVEAGQGDPVVLVHGGLQDYRLWREIVPRLAKQFRVIAYSRRNHFPNAVDADGAPDVAGDIHGEDLATLVGLLRLQRVHVVGHSSGAVAAMFFAAKYPELVRTVALNEPPAAGLLADTADGNIILREFGAGMGPAREAFRTGRLDDAVRLFVDGVGGAGAFNRRSEADQRMALDNALAHVADTLSKQPRAPFGCDAAKRITAPALLTNGERSPKFFHRIVDELARCLPRSERVIVPIASHTVPTENAESYAQAVLGFLSRN
jgi:non-heme chloroperoxidase